MDGLPVIKAILWDNDGVLVDTERLYFEATRRVMAEGGANLSEQAFVEFFMVRSTGAWHLAVERGLPETEIPALKERRNALYSTLLAQSDLLIEGAAETVRALAPRYRMAVVTSSKRDHFDLIHRNTGLADCFAFTLCAGDYTRYKPDPEPYALAAEKTGFRAGECLAVEDSERGLASASAAGVPCVVIPNGLSRNGRFAGAVRVLRNIRELPPFLATNP
jgi:HAD superfamily hydrolase (TIGR01509 family)